MFSPFTRLLLIAACLAAGVFAVVRENALVATILFVAAGMLVYSGLRYGAVLVARRHYRAGRVERAWRMLERTPFDGRTLARGMRSYYHLLRASCLLRMDRYGEVEAEARASLEIERKTPNIAAAHAALARAFLELGRRKEAADHLLRAKALPHKTALDKVLAHVEMALKEPQDP